MILAGGGQEVAKILVVDDETAMLRMITRILEKDGHQVVALCEAEKALSISLTSYSLILLDIMMPKMDGFTLCREIRDKVDCPILFLTAKTMEEDIIKGLGLGADDYLTKPFGLHELRARVNAHLRREGRKKRHGFNLSGLDFDLNAKEISFCGQAAQLTKGEYAICEYLALNHGQVFSKEQIYEKVFGFDALGDASVIAMHVKNIRGKLEKLLNTKELPIETVWGIGYKWK